MMCRGSDVIGMEEIQRYFLNGLCDIINTMTGLTVYEKEAAQAGSGGFEISSAMILAGKKNGLLVISAGKLSASTLVAYMTGADASEIKEEELFDGMAEMVNMVAGSAKARLANSQYSFNLSSPFSIVGEKIRLITKKNIDRFEYLIGSNEIELKLQMYYF